MAKHNTQDMDFVGGQWVFRTYDDKDIPSFGEKSLQNIKTFFKCAAGAPVALVAPFVSYIGSALEQPVYAVALAVGKPMGDNVVANMGTRPVVNSLNTMFDILDKTWKNGLMEPHPGYKESGEDGDNALACYAGSLAGVFGALGAAATFIPGAAVGAAGTGLAMTLAGMINTGSSMAGVPDAYANMVKREEQRQAIKPTAATGFAP